MSGITKTDSSKVGQNLTEGPIFKGLLLFSLPIVLTNIVQQLYSLVDLIVIGQFAGNTGTVGVSTGGEVVDLVTTVAMAFSSAGQIYIAQLVGQRKKEMVKKGIGTLFTLMIGMSVVFMLFTLLGCEPVLKLLNCPEEAMQQAEAYMLITGLGIPFIFGYNAICGILRGMGESKRPLYFIIIAAVINIFLDLILVVIFHMEAIGTAIATLLSQCGSFIAAVYFLYKHRIHFDFDFKINSFKVDRSAAKIIINQGIPQAARSIFVRLSLFWVNAQINNYGLIASATNSVGNKIQKFLDVFTSGISTASGAMVGQNLGAREQKRAEKTVWYTLASSMLIAFLLSLVSIFMPRSVFQLFTKDDDVLEMGVLYMRILIAHYIFSAITSSFQSMVIGSGFVSMNFIVGILDGVVCKIGLSILFATIMGMGVIGYFWAIGFSRALPGLICAIFFLSGSWKKRKLLSEQEEARKTTNL